MATVQQILQNIKTLQASIQSDTAALESLAQRRPKRAKEVLSTLAKIIAQINLIIASDEITDAQKAALGRQQLLCNVHSTRLRKLGVASDEN